MTWQVIQADARRLPLADASVDLIITSPPYWGLRSYRDDGEHYDGQIGSEDTPQQFVDELVAILDGECRRVLKSSGSLWLNLGDRYAGSGGSGTTSGLDAAPNLGRGGLNKYPKGETVARPKSLLGLPWRVALALIDRGWILRAEVIWSKPNGLPESVTDRVRRSHEQWFHLTLEPRYYSAVDRIREPLLHPDAASGQVFGGKKSVGENIPRYGANTYDAAPSLGRLPGSVRSIPTQPLIIPDQAKEQLGLVDHFAAFPMEWPRWIIEGWCPEGGVVADIFGGTGTTAGVAHMLGRHGISIDLSWDYNRLARWRIGESGQFARAEQASWAQRQEKLL